MLLSLPKFFLSLDVRLILARDTYSSTVSPGHMISKSRTEAHAPARPTPQKPRQAQSHQSLTGLHACETLAKIAEKSRAKAKKPSPEREALGTTKPLRNAQIEEGIFLM